MGAPITHQAPQPCNQGTSHAGHTADARPLSSLTIPTCTEDPCPWPRAVLPVSKATPRMLSLTDQGLCPGRAKRQVRAALPPCRLHASEDREPTEIAHRARRRVSSSGFSGRKCCCYRGRNAPTSPHSFLRVARAGGAHMQLPSTLQASWGDTLYSHLQRSLSSEKLVPAPRFTTTRDTLSKALVDAVS